MTDSPPNGPDQSGSDHPIVALTDADLARMLRRAIRNTAILGLVVSLVVWKATDWRNAAMLLIGSLISAAGIFEWQRLIRVFNGALDQQKAPRGAGLVVGFFLLRLVFFAAAIYVSLKGLHGSAIALLCGLSLALAALVWEAFSLLRQ